MQRHPLSGFLPWLAEITDDERDVEGRILGQDRRQQVQLQFGPAKGVLDAGIEKMVGARGIEADGKITFS
jgi:hypothetical protein